MNFLLNIIIALIGVVATFSGVILTYKLNQRQEKKRMSDKDIFWAWRIAFDRGAFRGPWRWPISYVDIFENAINDIIFAVDTGTIRNSDEKGKGKAYLSNPEWRSEMEEITGRLDRIIRLVRDFKKCQQESYTCETDFQVLWTQKKKLSGGYEEALQEHQLAQNKREKSLKEISEAVDHQRDEIIEIMNTIWKRLNINTMTKPTEVINYAPMA